MAPSSSSGLSADAPLFVPQAPPVPQPVAPVFVSYVPPPADLLPPMGLPCPFMGPCLPLCFGSTFQCLPPPLGFPSPVQGPPPPPGFPVSAPPLWGFPQGRPAVGPPPQMPMPHIMMARPAAPAGVQHATQPQRAALKDGDKPPAGSGRTYRATSGRWRSKPLPPRIQRKAVKRAPVIRTVPIGDGGDASTTKGDEASPRSVLADATTSPPSSPPILPAVFPELAPTLSSAPASVGQALIMKLPSCSGPRTEGRPVQSLPPPKLVPRRGACRSCQRPRRRFNSVCGLTTLMIRNIPNDFTRQKVMNIIDQHCAEENEKIVLSGSGDIKSEYDFLYVPFDFKTKANKGYCFVNLTSPDAAFRLWTHMHGFRWKVNNSRKMCEVDYATIQGRELLVAHFSKSCFDCDTEEFLPVWYSPPRNGTLPAVVERHIVGCLGRRGERA